MRFLPRSYFLIVLVTILMVTSSTGYAAFPLKPSQTATTNTETVAQQTDVDFKAFVNNAIEKFVQKPAPAYGGDVRSGAGLGIASFITGLAGLFALVLAYWAPILLGFVLLAGIAAIILGAKGMSGAKRGFAMAGISIGCTALSLLLVALFILFVAYLLGGSD